MQHPKAAELASNGGIMKTWLAPLIVGAFWLAILLIGMAGATVHTIVCADPDVSVCQVSCQYDDALSPTARGSHGLLCPASGNPAEGRCMYQFPDSLTDPPTWRSVPIWACTCDGKALPCEVSAGAWWCVGSWMPGC